MPDEPNKPQDETSKQTLVLIDGHALAYRAYFALASTGFQTRDGEPTHAVYGFALMLLAVWEEYNPDYLAVTFDTGDTFRHKQYAEYKATREKMPDDLGQQIGRLEELAPFSPPRTSRPMTCWAPWHARPVSKTCRPLS